MGLIGDWWQERCFSSAVLLLPGPLPGCAAQVNHWCGREGTICTIEKYSDVFWKDAMENGLWDWMEENNGKGERWGSKQEDREKQHSTGGWPAVNEQSCLLPSSSQKMLGKKNLSQGGLSLLPSARLWLLLPACVSMLSTHPQGGFIQM